MALFRSSSADPDPDRRPRATKAAGDDNGGGTRPAPSSEHAEPQPVDPLADRLQSRIAAFEADPDIKHTPRADRVAAVPVDAIEDLSEQLDVLRTQLEDAFEDVDGRIAAARVRADAAQARADAAHTRLSEIVRAIDQLAAELPSLVANDRSELDRLRVALARLKGQVDPDHPGPDGTAVTSPEPSASPASTPPSSSGLRPGSS